MAGYFVKYLIEIEVDNVSTILRVRAFFHPTPSVQEGF